MKARVTLAAGKALNELLPDQIVTMKRRIASGTDIHLEPFTAYTEEYAAYKKKRKRTRNVNMNLTGRMLGSIVWEVSRSGWKHIGRIFFNSEKQRLKAKGNTEYGREFFGLTKRQWQVFRKRLEAKMREAIKQ